MTTNQALSETPRKSLGNGLTLRYSTPEDIDCLVEFFARVLFEDKAGKSVMRMIEFHL